VCGVLGVVCYVGVSVVVNCCVHLFAVVCRCVVVFDAGVGLLRIALQLLMYVHPTLLWPSVLSRGVAGVVVGVGVTVVL